MQFSTGSKNVGEGVGGGGVLTNMRVPIPVGQPPPSQTYQHWIDYFRCRKFFSSLATIYRRILINGKKEDTIDAIEITT